MKALKRIRKLIFRLTADILYYSGIILLLRAILNAFISRKAKIILLYHRVTDETDFITRGMGGEHTSVINFKRHMRFVKRNYHIVPLKELPALLKNKGKNSISPIAITFDDGYRDNYTNAFLILKRYNVPATVFLMTDYVGGRRLMWRHKEYYYKYCKQGINEAEEGDLADKLYLSWAQVKEMYENGWDIGAHSRRHIVLTCLPLDEAREEITGSKRRIEEMLEGIEVKTFAYPFGKGGDFDGEAKEALKEAGFICACSAEEAANSSTSDPYALKRICVGNQSAGELAMKLLFYELFTRR